MAALDLPLAEAQRILDLWFPQASLILRAENSLFRVHGDLLGARSSVFRDMADIAVEESPDSGEDTVDGRNVIRLYDSAAEVEVFLRAIFDSSFFMPPPSPVDYSTVIGIMRLAHKYDVQYLFRRALSHLELLYPPSFPAFLEARDHEHKHHVRFTGDGIVDLLAIQAALEVRALWILPTAYYYLATAPDFMEVTVPDSNEQQRCLDARSKFPPATISMHRFFRILPCSICDSAVSKCEQAIVLAQGELERWKGTEDPRLLEPLSPVSILDCLPGNISTRLCSPCHVAGEQEFVRAQEEFWEELPSVFGLPSRAELAKLRRHFMDDIRN
ncbi:BTB domain-containing protein [Favolaschia claudopus]|uniref:BTB domain-containing protein n=1 Tax=Favolaschia claudopus TaxID=2862362 RepID=A0AAW0AJW8_9AGAR